MRFKFTTSIYDFKLWIPFKHQQKIVWQYYMTFGIPFQALWYLLLLLNLSTFFRTYILINKNRLNSRRILRISSHVLRCHRWGEKQGPSVYLPRAPSLVRVVAVVLWYSGRSGGAGNSHVIIFCKKRLVKWEGEKKYIPASGARDDASRAPSFSVLVVPEKREET